MRLFFNPPFLTVISIYSSLPVKQCTLVVQVQPRVKGLKVKTLNLMVQFSEYGDVVQSLNYKLENINSLPGLLVWKIYKGKFEVVSFVIWFARKLIVCLFVCLMALHATFNNIAVISWRSVLLVEETRGPGENHRPVAIH